MTERDKLAELLAGYYGVDPVYYGVDAHGIADHFLANGVKIPVLCKDCTSYNTKGCAAGFGWCEAWDQGRMDNYFCNCGERKNNE